MRKDRRTDGQAGRQAGRQTEVHEKDNSRFSQYCERALKTNYILHITTSK